MGLLASLAVSMLMTGGPAVAKQNVTVELFYAGSWHDHTADLDDEPIVINHGAGSEQGGGLVPTDGTLRFKSPDGRMNPDNPKGPFYGLIGEKTPARIKVSGDIRISGRAVKWQPRRSLGGSKYKSWVDVTIGGKIREMGQGEPPVESALYRAILSPTVTGAKLLAYWPMEGGGTASDRFGSALPGGQPMSVPGGLALAAEEALPGSRPLSAWQAGTSPVISGVIDVAATGITARTFDLWSMNPQVSGSSAEARMIMKAGDAWGISLNIPGNVSVFYYAGTSTFLIADSATGLLKDKTWHNLRLTLTQSGADINAVLILDGNTIASGTKTAVTLGVPFIARSVVPTVEGGSVGHINVWDGIPSDGFNTAGRGYPAEKAGDRFARICAQRGITATIVGSAADTQPMGPQFPDTDLQLFAEIAKTDAGIIHDTRPQEGLTFRTGRSLYNQ